METFAIAALGVFALGYFVLGGADIGVGMLLPVLGRDRDERRIVIAAIAPFFLSNEVWLVAFAGLLVGAFPALESELLSGLAPAVILLLLGWVCRDVGLWLRGRVPRRVWHALCDGAITGGSWAVALSWGWMFAGLFVGVTDEVVTGPGAVLAATAIAAVFATHGLAFAALRLSGGLRRRAGAMAGDSGEVRTFALTCGAMVALCVASGLQLPLAESAADDATLALILPTLGAIAPVLLGVQLGVWRLFRHRVEGPSYL